MSNLPDFGPKPKDAPKEEQLEIPFDNSPSGNTDVPDEPAIGGAALEDKKYDFDYDFGEDYGLLPPGIYDAYVSNAQNKVSNSGNPMIQWDFIIVDEKCAGYPLTTWTVYTKAALWKLEEVGAALGILHKIDGRLRVRFDVEDVKYLLCQLVVDHREYNGRDTENVAKVLPCPDGIGTKWESKGKLP